MQSYLPGIHFESGPSIETEATAASAPSLIVEESYTVHGDGHTEAFVAAYGDAVTRYDASVLTIAKLPRDKMREVTLKDSTGKVVRAAHFPPTEEVTA